MEAREAKVAAIVAAGGTGTRMNSGLPKQFIKIAGKPILLHTVECIFSAGEVTDMVIALPPEHISTARSVLRGLSAQVAVKCVAGGPSRQESVSRGLEHTTPDAELILVHDAVRPVCSREMIIRVLESARQKGGAVPGLPVTDTIQRVSRKGLVLSTPSREGLYSIQTPQAFRSSIIRSAFRQASEAGFVGTDESSVVRWAGHDVAVVPGSPDNIKITRPLDLQVAEILMSRRAHEEESSPKNKDYRIRVGHGIDYHRLVKGRKLILGGVDIPFERGLEGHSDADALSHAICDALLGAAALGDIGGHFPDTDSSNRNRSSLEFLRMVRSSVEAAGWFLVNVDATLLAQRPVLAPYVPAIRQNIADSLGLAPVDVNIKATTTEGLNAEGRGEGISAQAVALLARK